MPEIAGEFFDREADYDQWDRTRPHRHQSAAICFLTMRLNDSIPRSVILRWHQERIEYLQRMGVEVERNWKRGHEQLTAEQQAKFSKHFSRQRETTLDECLGGCELSDPRAREEVAKTLEFFHGQRYWLGDYVIMPNHIHCLVAFLDNDIAIEKRDRLCLPGGNKSLCSTVHEIHQRDEIVSYYHDGKYYSQNHARVEGKVDLMVDTWLIYFMQHVPHSQLRCDPQGRSKNIKTNRSKKPYPQQSRSLRVLC